MLGPITKFRSWLTGEPEMARGQDGALDVIIAKSFPDQIVINADIAQNSQFSGVIDISSMYTLGLEIPNLVTDTIIYIQGSRTNQAADCKRIYLPDQQAYWSIPSGSKNIFVPLYELMALRLPYARIELSVAQNALSSFKFVGAGRVVS